MSSRLTLIRIISLSSIMTLLTFFGCGLTAYGPALSIFFLHVAKDAQLVLLMVSSAFFWLISILLSSIIWYLIKPIYPKNELTILYSVILQEIFRWLLFNIMMRAEPGLILVANNPKSLYNRSSFAFVCGMGFGLMSGVVTYFTLLVNSIGPAVLMCNSCTALTVYIVGAFTTCIFIFLHIMWMMIAFEGFSKNNRFLISWVILSHFGASYATLLNNSSIFLGCVYGILINLLILGTSIGIVIWSLIKLRRE